MGHPPANCDGARPYGPSGEGGVAGSGKTAKRSEPSCEKGSGGGCAQDQSALNASVRAQNGMALSHILGNSLCLDLLSSPIRRRIRLIRQSPVTWRHSMSPAPPPDSYRFLPAQGEEPIPGYRLVEILGRGGYGEVWK